MDSPYPVTNSGKLDLSRSRSHLVWHILNKKHKPHYHKNAVKPRDSSIEKNVRTDKFGERIAYPWRCGVENRQTQQVLTAVM